MNRMLCTIVVIVLITTGFVVFTITSFPIAEEFLAYNWEVNQDESTVRTENYIYTAILYGDGWDDHSPMYYDVYKKDINTGISNIVLESFPGSNLFMIAGKKGVYLVQSEGLFPGGVRVSVWLMEYNEANRMQLLYYDNLPIRKYENDIYDGIYAIAVNKNCMYIIGSSTVYCFNADDLSMTLVNSSKLAYDCDVESFDWDSKATYRDGMILIQDDDGRERLSIDVR